MAFTKKKDGIIEGLTERITADFIQFSILKSSEKGKVDCENNKITFSRWKPYCDERNRTINNKKKNRLPGYFRICYGVGHVLNDLCASMWFSHFLVFFQKVVQLSALGAGTLLLIGQIVDGLATPLVGIESDRTENSKYGRRKVWHLGGCIAVALTFPFIFNLCIGCENTSHWSLFIYYVPFIVIFQTGWAATQISHLSLIPDLASTCEEKVILNALR